MYKKPARIKSITIICLCVLLLSNVYAKQQGTSEGAVKTTAKVSIDPAVKYQTFEGWGEGGMDTFTPAWYTLFRPEIHEMILDSMYTMKGSKIGKGLGLNICRFLMPMGDDPEHDHMKFMIPLANKPFEAEDGVFTWEGHEDILWRAKGAQKRGAKMWASFYSPPYWLTVSGCTGGSVDGKSNNLIEGKEERFAKHICDILKHFRDEWSIDFDYVAPINEPEANWWKAQGGSPGCHVTAEQAIVIIRELDKKLKAYGFDPEIHAFDAAYSNYYWYLDILLESDIEKLFSVITCHQYHSSEETMPVWRQRAVEYKKSLWMTEWGDWANAGYPNNKPYKQAMIYANKLHDAMKKMKVNAWIIWEPGFIYDADMFWLKPRKAYWVVAQYSRHIRPGYQQIDSKDSDKDCKTTAWIGENGKKLVLVSVNNSKDEISVSYDLSRFKGVKIDEVRVTSETQDYAEIKTEQKTSGRLEMSMSGGSVMTISASITK